MAIREIRYNVNSSGVTPSFHLWGGVQNEDNATNVVYKLDADYLSSLGENPLFRIDFNSASAGYEPSANLTLKNNTISRVIPKKMTQYGGQMQSTLVITKVDENLDVQEEVIQIPSTIFFTPANRQDKRFERNISAYEEYIEELATQIAEDVQGAKDARDNAGIYAGQADDAAEAAKKDAEAAQTEAGNAKKSAEEASASAFSASERANDAEKAKNEAQRLEYSAGTASVAAEAAKKDAEAARDKAGEYESSAGYACIAAQQARDEAEQYAERAEETVKMLPNVTQTTGTSETDVMSQKAVTDEFDNILEAFETTEVGEVSTVYNLLDPNNTKSGYYSVGSGNFVHAISSYNICTANFINIPSGATTIYVSTNLDTSGWLSPNRTIYIGFADENGNYLSSGIKNVNELPLEATIPEGAKQFHLWTLGNNPADIFKGDNFCVSVESDVFKEYTSGETIIKIKPTKLKESFVPQKVWDEIHENDFAEVFETELTNLLNPINTEAGYYSVGSGNFVPAQSAMQSKTVDFIPLPNGALTICVSTNIDTSSWASPNRSVTIGFADKDGNFLSTSSKKVSELPLLATIPNGATQFHVWTLGNTPSITLIADNFCVSVKSKEFVEYETQPKQTELKKSFVPQTANGNILYGKKWCVVGDSFTDNFGTDKPVEWFFTEGRFIGKSKVYANLIAERNNMNLQWMAASGRTLATPVDGTFTNTFSKSLYQQIDNDVDYITIMLGINDVGHNKNANGEDFGEDTSGDIPLGTANDTTNATFCGAWNVVLQYLMENHPNAHIGIIVPNALGEYSYKNAIIEAAKKYGIPYIDFNGDERTKAMHRAVNTDISQVAKDILLNKYSISETNRHPNALAHTVESTIVENFLRSI